MPRILAVIVLSLALCPASAPADSYHTREAGHPMRIAAYALHPIGYALDRLFFYPCWWVGQHEPFRTVFGVRQEYQPVEAEEETDDSGAGPPS